jgi:cell division septum initiation protein DivIVA
MDEQTSGGPPSVPAETYRALDSLEDLVDFAKQMGGHARSISLDEFHTLMNRLREELPKVIFQSESILANVDDMLDTARTNAEAILTEAQHETERIADTARKQAEAMVTDSPEVRFANAQHRDIVAQAQQAALTARQDVDAYVHETLGGLEDTVAKLQNQIRAGLSALEDARA